jgi:hypothetical protein
VTVARQKQAACFHGTRMLTNADMGLTEVRIFCQLDGAGPLLI